MKKGWKLLKQTVSEFMEDRVLRLSAALAYYAVFSIGPLLVLVIGLVGLLLGDDRVRQEIHQQLQNLVGEKSTVVVESMMAARQKGGSWLATLVGGFALIFGASGVFGQLQDSLNTIWEVKPRPGQGLWGFLRQRFLSMTMVLGLGFLLLVSMVVTAAVHALASRLGSLIGIGPVFAGIANYSVSFVVITLLFAAIFKVLPDVEIQYRDVWVGAVMTAVLFIIGQLLLGLYLGSEAMASGFGAASAFVVILMYVYYASVILFFGAEFTQVYARAGGRQIRPSPHAVPVSEEARERQGMPRDRTQPAGSPAFARQQSKSSVRNPKSSSQVSEEYPEEYIGTEQPGVTMAASYQTTTQHPPSKASPGEQVRSQPWSFVLAALGAGLAAGFFMKAGTARKLLKYYLLARRFV